MKREIKFRALKDDMSNCKFVYGQLIYRKEELSGNVHPSITEDGILFNSCLSNTESQFTGLTDKNGKEIYEGDIRKAEYFCGGEPCTVISVMTWDQRDANFCWISHSGGEWPHFIDTKIIGNIYENPELVNPPVENEGKG